MGSRRSGATKRRRPPSRRAPPPIWSGPARTPGPRLRGRRGRFGRDQVAVALIAIAPALIIPGGENRFVFAKVAAAAAGVAIAASTAARGRLPRRVVWLLSAGAVVLTVAILLSTEPLQGLVGRAPRYEGLPMIAIYAGAGWAGARLLGPDPPPRVVRTLIWTLCLTAVAVALVAIAETAGLRPLASDVARPGSLLGNASDEGALGVLVFGALGWRALADRDRVAAVGALAGGVTVAVSASRAALLGWLAAALVLALASPARQRLMLGGAAVLLAALTLAAPESAARVTGTSRLATATVHGRLLLWEETLALVGHHPALGVGADDYLDAITVEHDLTWQRDVGPANPPDSPHDWVLQAASDGGIPLAGIALALTALTGWAGWRRVRAARGGLGTAGRGAPRQGSFLAVGLTAGLVGYGVALAFGFTTPGTTPLAAFFGGAVLAEPDGLVLRRSVRAAGRAAAVTAGAALTVLAVLAGAAEVPLRQGLDSAAAGSLTAAQRDFQAAHDLRFWDISVAQTASYALVQVAEAGGPAQAQAVALARPWLEQVQAVLPSNEEQVLDEASAAEIDRRYRRAETLLRAALARDPDNPELLLRLGVLQGESGELSQATRTFLQVTSIAPTSPDPWEDLAIVYGEEHDSGAAAHARARASKLRRVP
ncbi:MAG: O-antigen ligase family protein [Acidimicrobiales bacterium]